FADSMMARALRAHPKAGYTTATDLIHQQHHRSAEALVRGVHTRIVRRFSHLGLEKSADAKRTEARWFLRNHTHLVRSHGLNQEFITPHCPQQNGMVERLIRTLKEQCAHRHRFETLQHASRVIGDWILFYNHRRPHQALKMKTPRRGVCFSGLTCAESAGTLHTRINASHSKSSGRFADRVTGQAVGAVEYWRKVICNHRSRFAIV
ncbi:MAG TPA: integrase core domain-containing protein, partial [Rudaea sp.]